jgi:hypothetical protein
MEVCDVVAFVSDPDSTISPSDGVDSDLDRREAMFESKRCLTSTRERLADFQTKKLR